MEDFQQDNRDPAHKLLGSVFLSLWRWITRRPSKSRFYVAYPPLDIPKVELVKSNFWEWLREPVEYYSFWRAWYHAEDINERHHRVVAVVVERFGIE